MKRETKIRAHPCHPWFVPSGFGPVETSPDNPTKAHDHLKSFHPIAT